MSMKVDFGNDGEIVSLSILRLLLGLTQVFHTQVYY